jgi:hypothetical protein
VALADDATRSSQVQIALSEFSALRTEITTRSTAQHTLINLSITATSAVGGFVLTGRFEPVLLLILPILSPALGMLYLDHALNIRNIGRYINKQLKPILPLMRYEEAVEIYQQHKLLRVLPYGLPIFIIFAGVPLGSLAATYAALQHIWTWVLWGTGLMLSLLYLSFWAFFMLYPFLSKSPTQEPPTCLTDHSSQT